MKILFILPYYLPKSNGGTEIYVQRLSSEILKLNNEITLLIPSKDPPYIHNLLNIETFDGASELDFIFKIKRIDPQIIHFHSLDGQITHKHLNLAIKLKLPVFFTPHLNNSLCLRNGSFRYKNKTECDKVINSSKCYICISVNNSLKIKNIIIDKLLKYNLNIIIPKYYKKFTKINKTFLALKKINVFALNSFQEDVFTRNGIKSKTITHGIDHNEFSYRTANKQIVENDKLKICYLGRISPEKGLHKLIEIYPEIKNLADLTVFGSYSLMDAYVLKTLKQIRALKIEFQLNKPFTEIVNYLENFDLLCITSLIYETGPMVTLEAFSLRIPVLSSKYASNYTINNFNGVIFDPDINGDLFSKIKELYYNRNFLSTLKQNITQPKTLKELALEHIESYSACM